MTISSGVAAAQTDTGDGVKIVGRWLNTVVCTGVAILASSDLAAVSGYFGSGTPIKAAARCSGSIGERENSLPYSGLASAREVNDETP